jgi:hypothetical protein
LTGKHQPVPSDEPTAREAELHERLRALNWPQPPLGARERGLEALRPHLDQLADPDANSRNGAAADSDS